MPLQRAWRKIVSESPVSEDSLAMSAIRVIIVCWGDSQASRGGDAHTEMGRYCDLQALFLCQP
jgi:hypothetical protein